ncbi:DUF1194 domain-containing protein [Amaricoccus sp.]|uniref:DUF1194 domain-containing protein n=1 Tax=Amaricoccus sp. TaxID=1872485 RepID=UPI0039E380BE
MRRGRAPALLAAAAIASAAAGDARAGDCRLALALALDVSSSVDAREYRLQTEGLAAALLAPEVAEAFLADPAQPVRLLVYEWSGWHQQVVRQDWVTIAGLADLTAVASGLAAQGRSFEQYPTALGMGLLFGAQQLAQQPACAERKLDVAGDGTNNDGAAPDVVRREAPEVFQPITINGLVIGSDVRVLGRYYQEYVVQGPGAFVEVATDYADFERAMRRKLLRELGVMQMSEAGPPTAVRPAVR